MVSNKEMIQMTKARALKRDIEELRTQLKEKDARITALEAALCEVLEREGLKGEAYAHIRKLLAESPR